MVKLKARGSENTPSEWLITAHEGAVAERQEDEERRSNDDAGGEDADTGGGVLLNFCGWSPRPKNPESENRGVGSDGHRGDDGAPGKD